MKKRARTSAKARLPQRKLASLCARKFTRFAAVSTGRDHPNRPLRSASLKQDAPASTFRRPRRAELRNAHEKVRATPIKRAARTQAKAPAARGPRRVRGTEKGAAGYRLARGSLAACEASSLAAEVFGALGSSQKSRSDERACRAICCFTQGGTNTQAAR